MAEKLIEISKLSKIYKLGDVTVHASHLVGGRYLAHSGSEHDNGVPHFSDPCPEPARR